MNALKSLADLIGAQALGDHVTAAVQDLVDREQIARADAYQQVTDAADAGDPAVLAATRQLWVRRHDVSPGQAPALRLYILERTPTSVFATFTDTDQSADGKDAELTLGTRPHGDRILGAELSVDVLEMYRLEAWEPFELLLPTAGRIDNIRPQEP
ncbi:hypothetical protein [Streptomyces zaomyceticus]|uniref:hypothetical protein n=1 Tax=Streptomyces zaomyceticus TaxID=68286 RepID=UPI0036755574